MEKVLFKSQPDPMTSQLAALLHQRYHLLKKDIETNISSSSVFRDVSAALSRDWQVRMRFKDFLGVVINVYAFFWYMCRCMNATEVLCVSISVLYI